MAQASFWRLKMVQAGVTALAGPLPLPGGLNACRQALQQDRGAFASDLGVWEYLAFVCLVLRVAQHCIADAKAHEAEVDDVLTEDARAFRWAQSIRAAGASRVADVGSTVRLGLIAWPGWQQRGDVDDVGAVRKLQARRGGSVVSLPQVLAMPAPVARAAGRRNESALPDFVVRMLVERYPAGGVPGAQWEFVIAVALALWSKAPDPAHYRKDMNKRAKRPAGDAAAPSFEFALFVAGWASLVDRVLADCGYRLKDRCSR